MGGFSGASSSVALGTRASAAQASSRCHQRASKPSLPQLHRTNTDELMAMRERLEMRDRDDMWGQTRLVEYEIEIEFRD